MQKEFVASWRCAKKLGVSRELALPLASLSQPWLPTLRPCRFHVFLQGLRDLSLPSEDEDASANGATTDWRVEIRMPDPASAALAAGAWFCHRQIGRAGAPTHRSSARKRSGPNEEAAALDSATRTAIDTVDESCLPFGEARSAEHLRYTPWALPIQDGETSESVGGMRRSESVPVMRRSASIAMTCKGCAQNPPQDGGVLPRHLLKRLCLTNPQVSVAAMAELL